MQTLSELYQADVCKRNLLVTGTNMSVRSLQRETQPFQINAQDDFNDYIMQK